MNIIRCNTFGDWEWGNGVCRCHYILYYNWLSCHIWCKCDMMPHCHRLDSGIHTYCHRIFSPFCFAHWLQTYQTKFLDFPFHFRKLFHGFWKRFQRDFACLIAQLNIQGVLKVGISPKGTFLGTPCWSKMLAR